MHLKRGIDQWLPSYLSSAPSRAFAALRRRSRLTHVLFLVCDHFEPRHGVTSADQPSRRLRTWQHEYPNFQQRCRTAFGHAPVHTWFYPPHHGPEHLPALADLAFQGGGEVELHYHHENDTAATLRRDLLSTLETYNRAGLLLESGKPPRRNFGFVHGDWTLDNACNGWKCGVNGELSILKDLGCWADFTMPSANEAQTRKINSIYYAVDDPSHSKSHDRGTDARVGTTDRQGFLLIQGPLGINWTAPVYPRIESASLTSDNWGRPDRVRKWVECNVHVKGRPEWLFVKLHTHGAIERDFDALFGGRAFEMHRALNELCNDGNRYQLHYVTARQAYNLVKAAEAGKAGDPREWMDYAVKAPVTSLYALDAEHRVAACTSDGLQIEDIDATTVPHLKTRIGMVGRVEGQMSSIGIDAVSGDLEIGGRQPGALISLRFDTGVELLERSERGAALLQGASPSEWHVSLPASCCAQLRVQKRAVSSAA